MPASSVENHSQPTISRISRLMRPLRSKCTALATYMKSTGKSSGTSATRGRSSVPLLASARATGIHRKSALEHSSMTDHELTRHIYAVSGAFRNIVIAIFGTPCSERIISLAAICGSIVGGSIPVTASDFSGSASLDDPVDEDIIRAFTEEIYESVPSHYRRFSVVSHALSIVLHTSRHHTLINILLDVCISFGILHDAQNLLNIVLSQVFTFQNPSRLDLVTYPAHDTYLVDLHTRWISADMKQKSARDLSPFTTSAFCQAVLSTFPLSGNLPLPAWNALIKLVNAIGRQDVDAFIRMISALTTFLFSSGAHRLAGNICTGEPRLQLVEWLNDLWDSFAPSWAIPDLFPSQRLHLLVDVLEKCCTDGGEFAAGDTLFDIVAVFATQALIHLEDFGDRLASILRGITPVPTTYHRLVLYLNQREDTQEFRVFSEHFMSQLKMYSSVLCSRKLLKLDASLWACALSYFERTIKNLPQENSSLLAEYRRKLMDTVDAAERRCFGQTQPGSSPPVSLPRRFKGGRRHHLRKPSGHWEWEEMVGCWIRATPVHKQKERLGNDQPNLEVRSLRHIVREKQTSHVGFASASRVTRNVGRRHSSQLTLCELSDSDIRRSEHDDTREACSAYSPRCGPLSKRPRTNFSTLLADAQTNRVVLHAKGSSTIPEKYVIPPAASHSSPPTHRAVLSPDTHHNYQAESVLSDDSLDLFAPSSPSQ
ncbi:hypothetical protein F5J12DRAFT_185108 [Pisolithus orientalis]|uniref:uncharacterized protein n=1 Tax=Pisolithus orientalis TaxID=936130 RepID=UPI002225614A|nr:uncharacterized protein F5J12DRAFT_185108 [Pisolithus orientalis]KAI6032793.1 hypothetical protein F5J12DRAFT_185108 [Pisolithus orientalis]